MTQRYCRIKDDLLPLEQIEPGRWYSLREACRFLPSPRGRGCLQKESLHDRHRRGDVRLEKRHGYWWVWGAELLRHAATPTGYVLPSTFVSPAERKRRHEAAMARARELGIID